MCKRSTLRKELTEKAVALITAGKRDLKAFEIGYQEIIEAVYPSQCWWQVTDCNIFGELLETQDVFKVIDSICDNLKEVF